MLRSSIFLPSDCTAQALAEFEKLVVAGGAVNPEGLALRIRNASRLLFLRGLDDHLVGAAALKHPRPEYRSKVFADARATVSADQFPVELGWVVVAQSYQGRRLSTRMVGELLAFAKNENIFATTRADERVLSFAFDCGFKSTANHSRTAAATILFSIFAMLMIICAEVTRSIALPCVVV